MVEFAKNEIADLITRDLEDDEYEIFKEIILKIINSNGYTLPNRVDKNIMKVIDLVAEKEIFFYDPFFRKVTGNNRIYEKAFERLK